MYKCILRAMVAVGLVMGFAVPTDAAGNGVIRIAPHSAGEIIAGGTVTICNVGTNTEDGYIINGKTGKWIIAADELFMPETATWVRKHARGSEITHQAEENGEFIFRDLDAGVYLVMQREPEAGFDSFHPFLIELPISGQIWEAEAFPEVGLVSAESPKTGDHPAPIFAAMALVLSLSALLVLAEKCRK